MNNKIQESLKTLRQYALNRNYEVSLFYHEEDSYLMRFANSAISLNTNEHLIRMEITAYSGTKRASFDLITNLDQVDEIKTAIDTAAEMVEHSQPLNYQPTIPVYKETFIDEAGYDPELATLSNEERLTFFNQTVQGLETDEIKLSGIFSNGTNIVAMINTRSEHLQLFKTSDAQVTMVLAHEGLKWEVSAEQSAQAKSKLDADKLHRELSFLVERYHVDRALQIELGRYDIVFGSSATADLVNMMNWIGFNGGSMKRGYSFVNEDKIGEKIFSTKFNLLDNPERLETFPFKRDYMGIPRSKLAIIQDGVFQGFLWSQDDADEFGAEPTGHTVSHKSLEIVPGEMSISSLEQLVKMPRDKDLLYIPFLHYMNVVNPSKGIITASSRFGALLLKADGSVETPYNVRLTQSLLDIFGDKVAWLSQETVPVNTSTSYGARNPTAIVVPIFMRVNDLEISHSNTSF